jgi:adenylate cyclase
VADALPMPMPMPMALPASRAELPRWLIETASVATSPQAWFLALGAALTGVGVPVGRIWFGTFILHPQVHALAFLWEAGAPEVRTFARPHGYVLTHAFIESPPGRIMQGAPRYRVKLHDPAASLEFPVLRDLIAGGATDYYAVPVHFAGKLAGVLTWTSWAPGGFRDDDIALLDEVRPIMAMQLRLFVAESISSGLLRAYLGQEAGERVLQGMVRRGDGETLRAAIWFCDLRNFTVLSETLASQALLAVLNAWFEPMVAAVEGQRGEVLKFMGDGMLAIFPATPEDATGACQRALTAAADAERRIEAGNAERTTLGMPPLRYGLALHFGDVVYGNIGSPGRLDFTVIGPAVNQAARLEGQCARLGHKLLLSQAFAALCPPTTPLQSLGLHALKGIAEPTEILALVE